MLEWSPNPKEDGVSKGVLYLGDNSGIAWNGLTGVTIKAADDTIDTSLYYDGNRFAFAQSGEDFGATVEAYTYPPEFDGHQGHVDEFEELQPRRPFGFSWRGGPIIHICWNLMAAPSDKIRSSKNNEMELSMFTWDVVGAPTTVSGFKPSAHLWLDTTLAPEGMVGAIEDMLYGTPSSPPRLYSADEFISVANEYAVLIVTDNGDGTVTVDGPPEAIDMLSADKVRITWPSVSHLSPDKVNIHTL